MTPKASASALTPPTMQVNALQAISTSFYADSKMIAPQVPAVMAAAEGLSADTRQSDIGSFVMLLKSLLHPMYTQGWHSSNAEVALKLLQTKLCQVVSV